MNFVIEMINSRMKSFWTDVKPRLFACLLIVLQSSLIMGVNETLVN